MSVINTNITSMIGQQNLNASKSALTTSMERLSSGLRINSAKDDAAGQAIANRMSSQITGLSQAQRNANDGISVAQTTEGALNQVNDNLQRIRELSVQAQNGTNSQDDLTSIQNEIGQRLNEINRISEETDFNGVKVLSSDQKISIQVGANDGQAIDINLQEINAETLDLADFSVQKQAQVSAGTEITEFSAGGTTNIQANGDIDVSSLGLTEGTVEGVYEDDDNPGTYYVNVTGDTSDATLNGYYAATIDSSTGVVSLVDSTKDTTPTNNSSVTQVPDGTAVSVNIDAATTAALTGTPTLHKVMDAEGNDTGTYALQDGDGNLYAANVNEETGAVSVKTVSYTNEDGTAVTDAAVGLGGLDGVTEFVAEGGKQYDAADLDGKDLQNDAVSQVASSTTADPLKALDSALGQVDALRSDLGAIQNRFESAITNLSTTETNLSAARSRIEDADYAVEVANMTRAQILQQAGTSVLAQANQVPQSVLSLLG